MDNNNPQSTEAKQYFDSGISNKRTYRELLELAAKAAGYKVACDLADNGWSEDHQCLILEPWQASDMYWNPKSCNAAAFQLVVDLCLLVKPGKHKGDGCTVESQRDGVSGATAFYEDKAEQMRMAIFLVAVAIGEAMP